MPGVTFDSVSGETNAGEICRNPYGMDTSKGSMTRFWQNLGFSWLKPEFIDQTSQIGLPRLQFWKPNKRAKTDLKVPLISDAIHLERGPNGPQCIQHEIYKDITHFELYCH
jgi:hypothetical protein